MEEFYHLRIDDVKNINDFIDKKYAVVTEVTRTGKVLSKYGVDIEEVNTSLRCMWVKVSIDVGAYLPYGIKRIVKTI